MVPRSVQALAYGESEHERRVYDVGNNSLDFHSNLPDGCNSSRSIPLPVAGMSLSFYFKSRMLTGSLLPCFLVALVVTSCDYSNDMPVRVDTLSSGRVVVSNPDLVAVSDSSVARLIEDLRIGRAFGDNPEASDFFGSIIAVTTDDADNIYVADHQSSDIRVFDSVGYFVRRIGRKGRGPGEFQFLTGVLWQRQSGILWARDPIKGLLLAFGSTGALLHENRHGDYTFTTIPWRGVADPDGHLVEERPKDVLVKYRTLPTGRIVAADTLRYQSVEVDSYVAKSNGVVARNPVPMSPYTVWATTPDGNAWLGVTSTYQLHEVTFEGDTVRTVELRRPASRLDGRERDSVATAEGLPARRLPKYKPVFRSLDTGPNGRLWVRVGRGDVVWGWDLFERSGYYLGRVESPVPLRRSARMAFGTETVTGVVENAVGAQFVVRLRLPELGPPAPQSALRSRDRRREGGLAAGEPGVPAVQRPLGLPHPGVQGGPCADEGEGGATDQLRACMSSAWRPTPGPRGPREPLGLARSRPQPGMESARQHTSGDPTPVAPLPTAKSLQFSVAPDMGPTAGWTRRSPLGPSAAGLSDRRS